MRGAAFFEQNPELHPAVWSERELGISFYPKQKQALHSVAVNRHTAVQAANGSGKTTKLICPIILWWLAVIAGKVVFTSASWAQIGSQILPAIRAHQDRLGGWTILDDEITGPNGAPAYAISTDHPGRFEGHHPTEDGRPLLMVFDEAKSIIRPIFSALDRCTYDRLLLASSTGLMDGGFYDACTDGKQGFNVIKITADDCPHITEEKKQEIITKYGPEHPQTRSQLYSEFMSDSDVAAACKPVKMHFYERNRLNPPQRRLGRKVAFCDFAAGGDENVLSVLDGNQFLPLVTWRERDTMAASAKFVVEFRKAGLDASDIWGDEGGLGRAMIDRLRELGWDINRLNNGEASTMKEYVNVAAEVWHEGGNSIENSEFVLPPDPEGVLKLQMTSRGGSLNAALCFQVEPKDKMKKRGVDSPDRADAVLGAMWASKQAPVKSTGKLFTGSEDLDDDRSEREALPGAWAG